MKWVLAPLSMVIAAVIVAGCGSIGARNEKPVAAATFNQADADFAAQMGQHHGQALEMVDMAESRAQSPAVRNLAARIRTIQAAEIDMFAAWLRDWGSKGATMPPHGLGAEEHQGPGMMSQDQMARLESVSRGRFDRLFLTMMISHHKGAITMAEHELSRGKNTDAQRMAENIRRTHSAEIAHMRTLLEQV